MRIGRLVVDEEAVDDGLAVRVGEDGRAEDLRRVQRGRRRQADLHRVEVIEHAAVLRDVVVLVAEERTRAPTARGRAGSRGGTRRRRCSRTGRRAGCRSRASSSCGPSTRLTIAWMVAIWSFVSRSGLMSPSSFTSKMSVKVCRFSRRRSLQRVGRLLAERVPVDEEEHAPEALRLEEPVGEADARARLARAGRHRHEQLAPALLDALLHREDRAPLVLAVDVRHRLDLELRVRLVDVLLQESEEALGRVPALERAGVILPAAARRGTRSRSWSRAGGGYGRPFVAKRKGTWWPGSPYGLPRPREAALRRPS